MHINVLELTSAFIATCTYSYNKRYKHIIVMSGSDIPVTYIDNKGGIKSKKCKRKMKIAKEIWL